MKQPSCPVMAFFLLVGVGCSSAPPETVGRSAVPATAPASQPAMEIGSYIHEAPLPAGYPPPGPTDKVLVKHYPPSRLAMVSAADMAGADSDGMFNPLFQHIQRNDIPMTAPVVMEMSPADGGFDTRSMAFVYPDADPSRPAATTGPVKMVDMPAMTVLSVAVRGGYGRDNFMPALEMIQATLAQPDTPWRASGAPRFLGYNSPFVPWFLKYGEVQVPVKPAGG